MRAEFLRDLGQETEALKDQGLFKAERVISTPQDSEISVRNGRERDVINLCANNYLGLANHPQIISAAKQALTDYGFGMASNYNSRNRAAEVMVDGDAHYCVRERERFFDQIRGEALLP